MTLPFVTQAPPSGSSEPHAVPGNWYDLSTLIAASAQSTLVVTANRLYLTPIDLPPCTIVLLGQGVNAAVAASNMRIGLYLDPVVGGVFGAPLVDSGDIATATTGAKQSGAVAIHHIGGVIWAAFLPSAAITINALAQTAQQMPLGQATANAYTRNGGLYFDTSYGALPSNFTYTGLITTATYPQTQVKVS